MTGNPQEARPVTDNGGGAGDTRFDAGALAASPQENLNVSYAAAVAPEVAPSVEVPAVTTRFEDVVSGQFDADEAAEELAPPKRVLLPMAETPKLHKVLAQSGMGSRLEMEQLILEGRISVNNEPAHIGQRIQFGDSIKLSLIHI